MWIILLSAVDSQLFDLSETFEGREDRNGIAWMQGIIRSRHLYWDLWESQADTKQGCSKIEKRCLKT